MYFFTETDEEAWNSGVCMGLTRNHSRNRGRDCRLRASWKHEKKADLRKTQHGWNVGGGGECVYLLRTLPRDAWDALFILIIFLKWYNLKCHNLLCRKIPKDPDSQRLKSQKMEFLWKKKLNNFKDSLYIWNHGNKTKMF